MKAYYEDDFVTIYHGDSRDRINDVVLIGSSVVLTGPPYFENLEASCDVIRSLRAPIVICQWNEIQKPPCSLPLVAAHIWINVDNEGVRYQPFYHFDNNGIRLRSAVMQYPTHDRTHPHDFPVALAQCLLMKTPASMPVFDPFCGSGATLIAAKQLKRKSIGIEIDETRLKMAVERLREAN